MTNVISSVQTVIDTANNANVLENNSGSDIYIVMWIILIVWIGIFLYMVHLDKKLKQIKQLLDFKNK